MSKKHKGPRTRTYPREWSPWTPEPPELARMRLPLAARVVARELHSRAFRAWQIDPEGRELSRVPFEASVRDLSAALGLAPSTVSSAMECLCAPRNERSWFVLDSPGYGGRPQKGHKAPGRSLYRLGPGHPWHGVNLATRRIERQSPLVAAARGGEK